MRKNQINKKDILGGIARIFNKIFIPIVTLFASLGTLFFMLMTVLGYAKGSIEKVGMGAVLTLTFLIVHTQYRK